MMTLIAVITLFATIPFQVLLHRRIHTTGGGIVRIYRALLMTLVVVILSAVISGARISGPIILVSYFFGMGHLMVMALTSRFWGKLGVGSLGVLYLFVGGYIYCIGQIPYGDIPFGDFSHNQPIPFDRNEFPQEWMTGLPLAISSPQTPDAPVWSTHPSSQDHTPTYGAGELDPAAIQWIDLAPVMNLDSHIRQNLEALRQHQERELSEMLAALNESSVHGTQMRRNAISLNNVEDLLRDGAISRARYQTFIETWTLADRDERAFRARQSQERFQKLLELIEDRDVTESHRVELIRFMVARFKKDVRLVQPLIRLFDALDNDYPRQKRLNLEFLELYLQRRKALFDSFSAIGTPCIQPLIDYRKKHISQIRYSQAALDHFLSHRFGAKVHPLYDPAVPVQIRDFLNREKYPTLGKLTGPAYDQDYLRRSLIRISQENKLPEWNNASATPEALKLEETRGVLEGDNPEAIDRLLIHPDPLLRSMLAWLLAEKKDPTTIPLIFELMSDVDPEVRRLAAVASGNFRIHDSQSSKDPKFREIVKMLVNFRTNSDAFARAFALSSLINVADRQKALYIIELVLNDGHAGHSLLGENAPSWADSEEREIVQGLISILAATPDEIYVKTHALKVLMAMDNPESLGVLMHYLQKVYEENGTRPSMMRFILPHLTLPQEAENIEDVIIDLAQNYQSHPDRLQQPLKVLRANLSDFYNHLQSAQFFQTLKFLEYFDPEEYRLYLKETGEHILLMRIIEYVRSTWIFWLLVWPLLLTLLLGLQYGLGLFGSIDGRGSRPAPNRNANPAADLRNRRQMPASTIVPVKINHVGR